MTVESAPVDSLVHDPRNARKHDKKNLAAIMDSLHRFGQQKPIVVCQENRLVVAGNGMLAAARELGWRDVQVLWTHLSGAEATAYGIADNRTAELAEWDYMQLSNLVRELKQQDADVTTLGFAGHELEPLLQAEWKPPISDATEGSVGGSVIQLTTEQKAALERVAETVRAMHNDPKMKLGRVIEVVCADFLRRQ